MQAPPASYLVRAPGPAAASVEKKIGGLAGPDIELRRRHRHAHAKRPAPQGLDVHGRPAPVAQAPQGDDHLDIPAFLRRQAH